MKRIVEIKDDEESKTVDEKAKAIEESKGV
jgi:hypothetical protein